MPSLFLVNFKWPGDVFLFSRAEESGTTEEEGEEEEDGEKDESFVFEAVCGQWIGLIARSDRAEEG